MKRRNTTLLMLPLMVSLCAGNMHARQDNNNGFIAGACAIGGALLAAAGIAAAIDYCWSETDEQLMMRVNNEYQAISSQYKQTMDYFGPRAGVGIHAPYRPIKYIPEVVLYEYASFVWNSGVSQQNYASGVIAAKDRLQSGVRDLRGRISSLERKSNAYEYQRVLAAMRNVLKYAEPLLADITLFADCIQCHISYLNLYDAVGKTHTRYTQEINISTSQRYTVESELRYYVLSSSNSQYPLRKFVKEIESDIALLNSRINSLAYSYDSARNDGYALLNKLIYIKNIIVTDSRYQQEQYAWEQARLERQRIQMMEEQARIERERIDMMRRQNRILEERNRIERQKMYVQPVYVEEVTVTVNF